LVVCSAYAACPFSSRSAPPSDADLARASKIKPAHEFTAQGARSIRGSLNVHLKSGTLQYPRHAPCEEFSLEQLAELQHAIVCHTQADLVQLSGGTHKEANYRAPAHANSEALSRHHDAEAKDIAADATGTVADAIRDGRCHSIAMGWVHHLSSASREAFTNTSFPLLPQNGLEEHTAAMEAAGVPEHLQTPVLGNLSAAVTCQIGHEASIQPRGKWEGFPHCPYEVTYNASGYGPYPFWTGGPPGSGGALSGKGADIHTYWSAVVNAEKLVHSSCSLSSLGGPDGPCTHLFLNGSWAFLYSQDESFCCMSSAPEPYTPCHLTRPQRNFMDVFNYDGVIDYKSEDGLYTGKAKKYSMHLTQPANFFFWYVTDMHDAPLEQGEGPCDMYDQWGTRGNCMQGGPHMLFHQYHTSTFKSTQIDPAVFERPEVCKRTPYTYCMVQPTNFCGDAAKTTAP